ncbi:MAG: HAMP domain-containing histidine kinase [Treponema sp.]|nr:HAMP domain-containing histidine kinase [Treponema sp.]
MIIREKTPVVKKLSMKFSLLLTSIIIILSTSIISLVRVNIRYRQNKVLVLAATTLQENLKKNSNIDELQNIEFPYYVVYSIYDADSGEQLSTTDPFLPKLPLTKNLAKRHMQKNYFSDGDLDILYYAIQFAGERNYIIQTAVNMETDGTNSILIDLLKIFLITIIPLLVISYIASRHISKSTLKSVHTMTEAARAITNIAPERRASESTSEQNISQFNLRLPVSNNGDEFDMLAQTLNDLLSRLQKDYEREKQFTADVSHELKTPIAVILGHAKLIKRWGKDDKAQLEKSLNSLIKEAHSMESIIINLLKITKLENGVLDINKTQINMKNFFARLKEDTLAWSPETTFVIETPCAKKVDTLTNDGASACENLANASSSNFCDANILFADEELVYEACTIIISNSVKFSNGSAKIKLCFKKDSERGRYS